MADLKLVLVLGMMVLLLFVVGAQAVQFSALAGEAAPAAKTVKYVAAPSPVVIQAPAAGGCGV